MFVEHISKDMWNVFFLEKICRWSSVSREPLSVEDLWKVFRRPVEGILSVEDL